MKLQRHTGRHLCFAALAFALTAGNALAASPWQDGGPRKARQVSPEQPQTAQESSAEKLPSADAILDRHIEAVGGAKAIKQQEYRSTSGTFEFVGAGVTGTFRFQQASPHFLLKEMNAAQGLDFTTGYNGEVGWTINSIQGPQLFEGDRLEDIRRDADFYGELNYAERYFKRETVAKEEFGGAMCYKLKLISNAGTTYESYFSIDTGLFAGMRSELDTPQGRIKSVTLIDEYKAVDGVKYPHKVTMILPDHHYKEVKTTTEITHEKISHDVFALPKPIQTLVQAKTEEHDDETPDGADDDDDNDANDGEHGE